MGKSQYDIWATTFNPIPNPSGAEVMVDNCMLETFGAELEIAAKAAAETPDRVWTLVSADNGKMYITQGFRRVNREGYIITELAYDANNPAHVKRFGSKDVFYA